MNACEVTAYVTAFANVLSGCCTTSELEILAVVFTQLGDTIATILTYRAICCPSQDEAEGTVGDIV